MPPMRLPHVDTGTVWSLGLRPVQGRSGGIATQRTQRRGRGHGVVLNRKRGAAAPDCGGRRRGAVAILAATEEATLYTYHQKRTIAGYLFYLAVGDRLSWCSWWGRCWRRCS